jgi:dihydroorotate dehydrogenase (fumarate)
MNLSTTYLGLKLPHPVMPGASPLIDDLDTVRRLEDAGAAALIMRSLFEEQLVLQQMDRMEHMDSHEQAHPEAMSYVPDAPTFTLGPEEYLEQIRKVKAATALPLIASLNGMHLGGWLNFARLVEEAGADALELNVYYLATEPNETGMEIEGRVLNMLKEVRGTVKLPVAVKLSPFYSSLAHFARELDRTGANGLVLFNRFYQADIDTEELEVLRTLELSNPYELRLRLRWLAVLSDQVSASLAVSGGVHTPLDAIKAVMTGAHAVQLVSALLRNGPDHLAKVRRGMEEWLEEHEYDSLEQMRGSMSLAKCPDPRAYERANYIEVLQSWTR